MQQFQMQQDGVSQSSLLLLRPSLSHLSFPGAAYATSFPDLFMSDLLANGNVHDPSLTIYGLRVHILMVPGNKHTPHLQIYSSSY